MTEQKFVLNLPKPFYPPIKFGLSKSERLETILRAAKLDQSNYILYVEASMVSLSSYCRANAVPHSCTHSAQMALSRI